VVQLIRTTTTRTGLKVRAELDPGSYRPGIKVTDAELAAMPLTRHAVHGEWNYDHPFTIEPLIPTIMIRARAFGGSRRDNLVERP
jgi:hypothetical protein